MAKATPGPWNAGISEYTQHVFSADGILCEPRGASIETRSANACLIAAAPELLEALKQLLSYGLKMSAKHEAPAFEAARSAIAKATGA